MTGKNMPAKVCQHCGTRFERRARLSDAQWSARRFCSKPCASARPAKRDADIVAMYQAQIPSTEIADAFGMSAVQVLRILRACGTTIRTFVEAGKISRSSTKRTVQNLHFHCEGNGFVVKSSSQRGAWNRPADLSNPSKRSA